MSKFTIFTVILAVSVITVTVDLAARDYFGEESQANVVANIEEPEVVVQEPVKEPKPASEPAIIKDSGAKASEILPQPVSEINDEIVKKAGFTDAISEKQFSGKVFQLLDITKIPVDAVYLYEMQKDGVAIVSVTEIALKDEIRALQMYILLQNKTKTYIDLTLNETNAYGDRSFYINHAKKPDEAFLTVKVGNRLYSFAYVKSYHPQVKKLIELLAT